MSELAPGITMTADPGGRSALQLEGSGGRVVVATTGAQVLSWLTPAGDVLWTASHPRFRPGEPVRGGIPLVFPWFGDDPTGAGRPAHGFARTLEWQVTASRAGPTVVLSAADDAATRALWPHAFRLELAVGIADELRLALTVTNTGSSPFTFEQALHSYFAVGDIGAASVHGLEGLPFVEQAAAGDPNPDPAAPVRFVAETDRIYQGVPDRLTLRAPRLDRSVRLASTGARSAIVWNPWPEKTARLSQMDLDDWRRFCCVETANVREHAIELAAGAQHTLELAISWQRG